MKAKERHDIKTDKFLETVAIIEDFLVRHAKTIGLGFLAIIVITAITIGTVMFLNSREENAARDLNAIIDDIHGTIESDSSESEDIQSLITETRAVIENHGGTASGIIGNYYLGLLLLKADEQEDAEKEFRNVMESNHPTYWSLAAKELATILIKKDNFDEAASVFSEVANSNNLNLPKAYFAWRAGLCYEKLGDKNQALLYFNKAKEGQDLTLDAALLGKIERKIQELSRQ